MIAINIAHNEIDFATIERLAREIFHEVYDPIIPPDHTDFFLNKFQTVSAIKKQTHNDHFLYYILTFNNTPVGYLGIQQLKEKLLLSKLYILSSYRGKGIGKAALNFVDHLAHNNGVPLIELIVNRQNRQTIDIYLKNGFEIAETILNSFDNGHTIEDYKMEKRLSK